jgi:hypothetical protein
MAVSMAVSMAASTAVSTAASTAASAATARRAGRPAAPARQTPRDPIPGSPSIGHRTKCVNRSMKKISHDLIHEYILGDMGDPDETGGSWTLLTGHGHVLVEIARNPDARIRDISAVVGLTDRTVQAIVADLEAAGYLTRTRTGRRTRYTVNPDRVFRHSAQDGHRVGALLDLLSAATDDPQDLLCRTGTAACVRPP